MFVMLLFYQNIRSMSIGTKKSRRFFHAAAFFILRKLTRFSFRIRPHTLPAGIMGLVLVFRFHFFRYAVKGFILPLLFRLFLLLFVHIITSGLVSVISFKIYQYFFISSATLCHIFSTIIMKAVHKKTVKHRRPLKTDAK